MEISVFFNVSEKTIYDWKKQEPEFLQSIKAAKEFLESIKAAKNKRTLK